MYKDYNVYSRSLTSIEYLILYMKIFQTTKYLKLANTCNFERNKQVCFVNRTAMQCSDFTGSSC